MLRIGDALNQFVVGTESKVISFAAINVPLLASYKLTNVL